MKIIYLSLMLMIVISIILTLIYIVVRIAIKHSLKDNRDNINIKIKEAVQSALKEDDFKRRNKE